MNGNGRHRKRAGLRFWVPVLVVAFGSALLHLPQTFAAFTGSDTSPGNSVTAAAVFPDYPATVNADAPLFYHRLDDAPGSVTAEDSSAHAAHGIYATAQSTNTWTGLWPLDENSGPTATDLARSTAAHDLTLHGATWTPSGRSGSALAFDGTSAYAAAASSALATNASFTASAWVYLTDTSVSRTAVSQAGTDVSGFELGYDQGTNRWTFVMPHSDSAAAPVDRVVSTAAAAPNTWTQLTAVFNAGTTGMDLWVNGVKQTGLAHTLVHTWAAGGVLEVGAGRSTSRTRFWHGVLDNVRINTTPASTANALELTLASTGSASTSWRFDEAGGSSTTDFSGNLNTGTLGAGVTRGAAKSGAAAVDLPGTAAGDGYVAAAAPAVDTGKSFTVAAWVYLNHTTLGAMSRVAVSQSGGTKSGFMLRYDHTGTRWEFAVTSGAADDSSPSYDSSASAGSSAALTTWTHLIGVHDGNAQTVTLYVNGVAMTPAAHTSLFDATGPTQVGRVREYGAWQVGNAGGEARGPWAGSVDELRAYRRALRPAEITALFNGANAPTSLGMPGALQGSQQGQTASTAQSFGAGARAAYNPTLYNNPTTYSLECWFRTAAVAGAVRGRSIFSFSNRAAGNTPAHDRRLFLDTAGHVVAGTSSGISGMVASPATYFDGAWHHAVVTVSPGTGTGLYLDGVRVASGPYDAPANFAGYWRWGGDTWDASWPTDYFEYGGLDEVAVYDTVLSDQQVSWHYHANH
jgi:hypothetical protein